MGQKFRPNPLGHLMGEIVHHGSAELGSDYVARMREQTPVTEGLAGQDTFKQEALKKPTSRADIERRRMHIDSGADLKGVDMFKELGGGTGGQANEFTSDKSA